MLVCVCVLKRWEGLCVLEGGYRYVCWREG